MSLRIQIHEVGRVLLANGWYTVAPDPGNPDASSFDVDAYEYVDGDAVLVVGGNVAGVVSTASPSPTQLASSSAAR